MEAKEKERQARDEELKLKEQKRQEEKQLKE
jgi:hypothetical protein